MKKAIVPIFALLLSHVVKAQTRTWDGSAGTNWNVAANWSGNVVPNWSSNVIIPNTTNKPVLDSTIRVASLNVSAGAEINFNGYAITVQGAFSIKNATLNNSNPATDILITLNGAVATTFGGNTINDHFTLNRNGNGTFWEGHDGPDIFNGNASFNIAGTGDFYISYGYPITVNGNLAINRATAGLSQIFNLGFGGITGNFSYLNSAGGITYINPSGIGSGPIGGTVNITANGTGNPVFQMMAVTNLTPGGTISIQNSGGVSFEDDTIQASVSITGVTTSASDYIRRNSITGNFTYTDVAANTAALYIDGTTITGTTAVTINSNQSFFEGFVRGDIFNGNTSFDIKGTGQLNTSRDAGCTFNGNLSISRTAAGITSIFNTGSNSVSGNFSYTNAFGGSTTIGQGDGAVIGGTINITATGAGAPVFKLFNITNQTTGGTITVQNSGQLEITNDTLAVTSMAVTGFSGSTPDYVTENTITGDLTLSDSALNTNAVYLQGNTFNGNVIYTVNSVTPWYESYISSQTYLGNLTINRLGATGSFSLAFNDTVNLNKNLVYNSATGIAMNNAVAFIGSSNSTIDQLGSQPISFANLIMNKTGSGSLTLNDSLTITSAVRFAGGHIYTSAGSKLIFANNSTVSGTSVGSHVIGPVDKIGDAAFVFPLGTATSLNTVGMSAPGGTAVRYSAEYKPNDPTVDGYNTAAKVPGLVPLAISKMGYWNVQRLVGGSNVTLSFRFMANANEAYPTPLTNLKVAHWNGSQWEDFGSTSPTGTAADGTITNGVGITSYTPPPFALAGVLPTYRYTYSSPGSGPDGTPIKLGLVGNNAPYSIKQLPAGSYTTDSIFLIPNGSGTSFRGIGSNSVETSDTLINTIPAPNTYNNISAYDSIDLIGWRNFVYYTNHLGQIMGAIKDNGLKLGITYLYTYVSTGNIATAPNGNIYLKRSFRITSQLAPAGTRRVRFYISKTEYNNLVAADPTAFPNGINSLTITKYNGAMEDSLFNPMPGGNASIIPNSAIIIADLGTMYSLDIDVTGFSGFYIGGSNATVSICGGSNISIPAGITGASYQWQVNNGGGFTNLANSAAYSGVTTSTLTISNAASSLGGNQYRVLVNGVTPGQSYLLKISAGWQGTISNAWENPANWSCGSLPDLNTDVTILAATPNMPQVNSNVSVKSLKVSPGTTVTVKTGFNITVRK